MATALVMLQQPEAQACPFSVTSQAKLSLQHRVPPRVSDVPTHQSAGLQLLLERYAGTRLLWLCQEHARWLQVATFRKLIAKVTADKHEEVLCRQGAIMAGGIMDAGALSGLLLLLLLLLLLPEARCISAGVIHKRRCPACCRCPRALRG